MPDQRGEHSGSLLHHSRQSLSRRPPRCTGTLGPRHGPFDSCIQAETKTLQTCCEDFKAVDQCICGGSSGMHLQSVILDCADWEVFRTATNSLDEYTEAVYSRLLIS